MWSAWLKEDKIKVNSVHIEVIFLLQINGTVEYAKVSLYWCPRGGRTNLGNQHALLLLSTCWWVFDFMPRERGVLGSHFFGLGYSTSISIIQTWAVVFHLVWHRFVGHFGGGGGGGVTSWRSENYMPEFIVISIEGVRLKNSLVSLSRIIAQTWKLERLFQEN